jgi:hypothetical protein
MRITWIAVTIVTAMAPFASARAQEPDSTWDDVLAPSPVAQSQSSSTTDVDVNMNVTTPAAPAAATAPGAAASATNETHVVVNGNGATTTAIDASEEEEDGDTIFLHGFRLGYLYIFGLDTPVSQENMQPYGERYGIRSPHSFMLGYEIAFRLIGHDWLNMLLIANVMIAGLEQSRFFPSGNLLLGFEIAESVQVGVGVSLTPTKDDPAHMIFAAGWTPRVGSFYVPVHFFFVPDINGHHKLGATVGVNFG